MRAANGAGRFTPYVEDQLFQHRVRTHFMHIFAPGPSIHECYTQQQQSIGYQQIAWTESLSQVGTAARKRVDKGKMVDKRGLVIFVVFTNEYSEG